MAKIREKFNGENMEYVFANKTGLKKLLVSLYDGESNSDRSWKEITDDLYFGQKLTMAGIDDGSQYKIYMITDEDIYQQNYRDRRIKNE